MGHTLEDCMTVVARQSKGPFFADIHERPVKQNHALTDSFVAMFGFGSRRRSNAYFHVGVGFGSGRRPNAYFRVGVGFGSGRRPNAYFRVGVLAMTN
jgi:hypothetical protein